MSNYNAELSLYLAEHLDGIFFRGDIEWSKVSSEYRLKRIQEEIKIFLDNRRQIGVK